MPEPVPKALVSLVFGAGLPAPLLVALSAGSHLGYGGVFGAALARFYPEAGIREGFGLGVLLWLVMEIVVLPVLGWGFFGAAITPKIAVATLVLHLIYGGTLGWGLRR
jgi:ABC-type multidrug transport system permease subunit